LALGLVSPAGHPACAAHVAKIARATPFFFLKLAKCRRLHARTTSPCRPTAHLQSMANRPTVDSAFNTCLNSTTPPPPLSVTAGLTMANCSPNNSPAAASPHRPSAPIKGGDPCYHSPHLLVSFSRPSELKHRHYRVSPPPSPGRHTATRAPVRPETGSPCSPLSFAPSPASSRAPEWSEARLR
jgi:hypothetical protein